MQKCIAWLKNPYHSCASVITSPMHGCANFGIISIYISRNMNDMGAAIMHDYWCFSLMVWPKTTQSQSCIHTDDTSLCRKLPKLQWALLKSVWFSHCGINCITVIPSTPQNDHPPVRSRHIQIGYFQPYENSPIFYFLLTNFRQLLKLPSTSPFV